MYSNAAPSHGTDSDGDTKIAGRLPIEIMTMIARKLADDKDYQALGRIQRTSRVLYLLATPMLYEELGPDIPTIYEQLGGPVPLNLERLSLPLICSIPGDEHPVDLHETRRLFWICSNVKRVVYRPLTLHGGFTEAHQSMCLYLIFLGRGKGEASSSVDRLFPSLEDVIIDLSQLLDQPSPPASDSSLSPTPNINVAASRDTYSECIR